LEGRRKSAGYHNSDNVKKQNSRPTSSQTGTLKEKQATQTEKVQPKTEQGDSVVDDDDYGEEQVRF